MKVGKLLEELDKLRSPQKMDDKGELITYPRSINDWEIFIEHTDGQTFEYLKNNGWKTEEWSEWVDGCIDNQFVQVDEMCGFFYNEAKKRIYLQYNF